MKTVKLPDRTEMFCVNPQEALWLWKEVQGYLAHGITLKPNDTVIDVGANVGTFSLMVSRLLNNDVDLYSVEPIPEIFAVLARNAERHNPTRWKCLNCGLGATAERIEFNYFPSATMISNALTNNRRHVSASKNIIAKNPARFPFPANLLRFVIPRLRRKGLDLFAKGYFASHKVECQVRPLSDVIKEEGIARIDLLKIDVEHFELPVLQGISAADWQRIQQVVVEVHDIDGRMETVLGMLRQHGLRNITSEQEEMFEGSTNYNVFARRDANAQVVR